MKAGTWATIVLALLLWPVAVRAQQVSVDIGAHGVTLAAKDVTLEQILAEWSRVGGVEISVRGSGFSTAPVTLSLEGIAERKALEILLRDVGGYLLVGRQDPSGGSSAFRQVVIVPRRGDEPLAGVVAKEPPRPRVVRGRFARAADSVAAQPLQAAPGPDRQQEEDFFEAGAGEPPESQGDPELAGVPPTRSPTAEASGADRGTTASTNPQLPPPLSPMLPPAPAAPGPGNPFGVASGAARPGTMTPGTQPPPGVAYPVVTNPDLEGRPFTPGK